METLIPDPRIVEWAILSVSLFNTMLLFWLGLTVLLNAERRTWGIWLAGAMLLLGAAFFIAHTIILAHDVNYNDRWMNFWWHVGWIPVAASPLGWYVVMLWYSGFWEGERSFGQLRRQGPWLAVAALFALALVGMLIFANPLPRYSQVVQLNLSDTPSVGGIPLLVIVFSVYMVLCISLSLDVLRHPRPSGRVMGDLARRRARPWLAATSAVLLLVSLLVAGALVWVVLNAHQRPLAGQYSGMALPVALIDLAIGALLGLAFLLLGQAVVSYEIFTGKTLPRRGFRRQWRSAVILSAGYSALVSASLALQLHPINGLVVATLLMITFYALFSWRTYIERERYIQHLSPFVASQGLHEYLLTPTSPSAPAPLHLDAHRPFQALCENVLGASKAYLVPLGALGPLIGPGLAYPPNRSATLPRLPELSPVLESTEAMCVPLDPTDYEGAQWAVPLRGERGLVGVLLLGPKRDGGLYTEEEIEVARASGERLVDTQATAEMARRLMVLQRQRLADTQIIDRRARRVLHDDILPRLHTAMLALSKSRDQSPQLDVAGVEEALTILADAHRQVSDLLREMPTTTAPDVARLGLVGALRKSVDDELGNSFDSVSWQIDPNAAQQAQAIPSLTAEVLYYATREAIRNSAHYGRNGDSKRPLRLTVALRSHNGLELTVEDDGVGLEATGGSNGGSGQGLALHSTMMAVVGGTLTAESAPGKYTRVRLTLPQGA